MTWSPQQDAALLAVNRWLENPCREQVFRLFGYAGTGKTTLAKEIAAAVGKRVKFAAFTGKAAHVLAQKGCDGASTIHSLIYKLENEDYSGKPTFVLNQESDVARAKLVIIDEVSMVDEALGRDLLSFGVPVLVLGDPAQLPPVKGQGFFTSSRPDIMLTEVHRQAEGSPIIHLATAVRKGEGLKAGAYGECKVIDRRDLDQEEVLEADQILVGLNRTRHSYNGRIRVLRRLEGEEPQRGEKLVCLKNDKACNLLNGSLWKVTEVKSKPEAAFTKLRVLPEDDDSERMGVQVEVAREFWTGREDKLTWEDKRGSQEFTFGYALTCHKSQGSQWNNVMVFDESRAFRENRQEWLYTAITRAAEKLTVVQL